jgi:hypothetical protein
VSYFDDHVAYAFHKIGTRTATGKQLRDAMGQPQVIFQKAMLEALESGQVECVDDADQRGEPLKDDTELRLTNAGLAQAVNYGYCASFD